MTTTPELDELYRRILYVFCRDPNSVNRFDAKAEEIVGNATTRRVVAAAQRLKKDRVLPTPENLAAAGAATILEIEEWSYQATTQMLEDFGEYAPIVRRAALHYNLGVMLRDKAERLAKMGNLFDVEPFYDRTRKDLATLFTPTNTGKSIDVFDILTDSYKAPKTEYRIIPTGFPHLDAATPAGGMALGKYWVFGGPMKGGKTSNTRSILMDMSIRGVNTLHIAHDGGKARLHAYHYWCMAANRIAFDRGVKYVFPNPDKNATEPLDALVPEYMYFYHKGEPLPFRMTPDLRECIEDGLKIMEQLKMRNDGFLRVVDGTQLNHNLDKLWYWLESQHDEGMQVFLIDHIGKFGDFKQKIFDRISQNALLIDAFISEHDVAGMVLSQLNKTGVEIKDDDDTYAANLEGGEALAKEADLVILVRPGSQGSVMSVKLSRSTKGKQKWDVTRMGGSGLMIDFENQ